MFQIKVHWAFQNLKKLYLEHAVNFNEWEILTVC